MAPHKYSSDSVEIKKALDKNKALQRQKSDVTGGKLPKNKYSVEKFHKKMKNTELNKSDDDIKDLDADNIDFGDAADDDVDS